MSKRRIETTVPSIAPTATKTHIEVAVAYRAGGMNYFSYTTEPRGYYVTLTPTKVEEGSRSFILLSGRALFVKAAARFSDKVLAALAARIAPEAARLARLFEENTPEVLGAAVGELLKEAA